MTLLLLWLLAASAPPAPRVSIRAGARKPTVERAWMAACPAARVTTARRADYVFTLDHQAWRLSRWKHDGWELARADGDVVAAGAAASVKRAVKAACAALVTDRQKGAQ